MHRLLAGGITTQRSLRTAFVVMIAERWMMIIGCQHYGRS
jgi:hypothetical protein